MTENAAMDLEVALEKVGGDNELLAELAGMFTAESAKLRAALREGIASEDARATRAAAHSLKGSLGVFAAKDAADLAAQLEDCVQVGQFADAGKVFQRLEQEIQKVCAVLESWRTSRLRQ